MNRLVRPFLLVALFATPAFASAPDLAFNQEPAWKPRAHPSAADMLLVEGRPDFPEQTFRLADRKVRAISSTVCQTFHLLPPARSAVLR